MGIVLSKFFQHPLCPTSSSQCCYITYAFLSTDPVGSRVKTRSQLPPVASSFRASREASIRTHSVLIARANLVLSGALTQAAEAQFSSLSEGSAMTPCMRDRPQLPVLPNTQETLMRTHSVLTILSIFALSGAIAQAAEPQFSHLEQDSAMSPKGVSMGCDDGIILDDGTFENATGPGGGTNGAMVQHFTPFPGSSSQVEEVCLCFFRQSGGASTLDFDIVAYDDDGPGGSPGTLLGSFPASVTPSADNTVEFFSFEAPAGFNIPTDGFFLGAGSWNTVQAGGYFLCHDITEMPGEPEPAYFTPDSDATAFALLSDFTAHNALGVRVKLADRSLTSIGGWILPGFEVEIDDPTGPTVQWAIRNQSDNIQSVDLRYYGRTVTSEPLRDSIFNIGPQATVATDIRFNLNDLEVREGFATGVAIAKVAGGGTQGIAADYFRIDEGNAFATGNRWVNPSELCDNREARLVDFGGGTIFRVLLNQPQGPLASSFSYQVFDFNGNEVINLGFITSQHYLELDTSELNIGIPFGTVVFSFAPSAGGWVSARYSAFGQFSTEVVGACPFIGASDLGESESEALLMAGGGA